MSHKVRFSSDPAIRGTGNKSHLLNVSANGQSSWEPGSCQHLVGIQRHAHKMSMESCPPSEAECCVAVLKLTELSVSHLHFQQSKKTRPDKCLLLSCNFSLSIEIYSEVTSSSSLLLLQRIKFAFAIFTRKPLKSYSYETVNKHCDSQTVLYIQKKTDENQIMCLDKKK